MKLRLVAASAAVAAGLLGVLAAPASASTSTPQVTQVPASADGSTTCFGYKGTFADGSTVFDLRWSQGPEECFGVAPSGTIWHTWPNAGGWVEMPGNGRAVDMWGWQDFGVGVGKAVKVVTASGTTYCEYDDYATNTWGGWYEVDPVSELC